MNRVVSVVFALAPVFLSYKSPIPEVDFFSFMIIILWFIHIISGKKIIAYEKNYLLPLLLYVIVLSPICILHYSGNPVYPSTSLSIFRLLKYLLLCTMVSFTLIDDFDIEYGLKVMKVFVYLTTIIVVFQQVAFSYGVIVRNPLLSIAINEAYNMDSYTMELRNGLFRPSALFLEPSHLSQYFIIFLVYSLLSVKISFIDAFVASVGLMATGSGMGVFLIILVFSIMILLNIKRHPVGTIMMLFLFLIICAYLYNTDFFQLILYRILDGSETGGNAIEARSGAGYRFFMEGNLIEQLFGHGFGNVPLDMYINGAEYSLISIGFVGVIILFIVSIRIMMRQPNRWQKMVWLFYVILLFAAQLFSVSMLYYYVFAVKHQPITESIQDQNVS